MIFLLTLLSYTGHPGVQCGLSYSVRSGREHGSTVPSSHRLRSHGSREFNLSTIVSTTMRETGLRFLLSFFFFFGVLEIESDFRLLEIRPFCVPLGQETPGDGLFGSICFILLDF